jgi:hypothetical protein
MRKGDGAAISFCLEIYDVWVASYVKPTERIISAVKLHFREAPHLHSLRLCTK